MIGVQKPFLKNAGGGKGPPCKFWAENRCMKGDACPFSHGGAGPAAGGKAVGKGWEQSSKGWKGGGAPAAKGTSAVPCKFYAAGTCTKGESCPFMHGGGGGALGPGGAKGGWAQPAWGKGCGKCFGGKDFGKGKDMGKGKGKDMGKNPNKGKGHLLPRTRISEAPFTGTVAEWKGKYGWIECAEPIEHEKATKHGGKLFVGIDDINGLEGLEPGTSVSFHIWEDVSGLGADDVNLL